MKLKKTALVGTLQKTGLELRRAIIKEVRGHFVKCRFYSTQERLSIGDYGWNGDLSRKGERLHALSLLDDLFPVAVVKSLAVYGNFTLLVNTLSSLAQVSCNLTTAMPGT